MPVAANSAHCGVQHDRGGRINGRDLQNVEGWYMEPKLQQFLDLVDCRPEDVQDIPAGRPLKIEEARTECEHFDPAARRTLLGEKEVYFGMHQGKKLKDLPPSYLQWALGEE